MAQQRDRITIYGPKDDGTYIVEFGTARRALCHHIHDALARTAHGYRSTASAMPAL